MKGIEEKIRACMNLADNYNGVHSSVCAYGIYSQSWVSKFRKYDRNVDPDKAKDLLSAYEIELKKVKNRINQIEVNL